MPDGDAQAAIPVMRCGAIAREVLADAGETRVIAVFDRSFYLACPRGIVCIGTAGIGAGHGKENFVFQIRVFPVGQHRLEPGCVTLLLPGIAAIGLHEVDIGKKLLVVVGA